MFFKSLTAMAYQLEHNHFPAVDPLDAGREENERDDDFFWFIFIKQKRHLYIKCEPKGDSYTI